MIVATRRWLRRNRTRFAVGFGVVGASYIVGQYVIGKITEMRERANNERIAKENLRRRFKQNQEDCTFTVVALLPTVTDNVLAALPVESITRELQQQKAERLGRSAGASDVGISEFSSSTPSAAGDDGKSIESLGTSEFIHTSQMGASAFEGSAESPRKRKSKAQLWDDLKINSITRTFTLIYTLALLTILTRLQLNLLGRRSYVSSVISLAAPRRNDSTISLENHENSRSGELGDADFENNRNFLAFSWWLLHRGWRDMQAKVEAAVKEVFGPLSPREEITFSKLSELVIETRKKIEGSTEEDRRNHKWLSYLLPPPDREIYVLRESGVLPSSPPSSNSSSLSQPSPSSDPGITLSSAPQPTSDSPSNPATSSSPSTSPESTIPPPLRRLLDELSDLTDSPPATRVTTLLLDALFSRLVDNAIRSQAYPATQTSTFNPSTTNPPDPYPPQNFSSTATLRPGDLTTSHPYSATMPGSNEPSAKLATILAIITRQARVVGAGPGSAGGVHVSLGVGVENEYVQVLEEVREVEALAAVVFTTNRQELDLDLDAGAFAGEKTTGARKEEQTGVDEGGRRGEGGEDGEGSRPVSGIFGAAWGAVGGVWGVVVGR